MRARGPSKNPLSFIGALGDRPGQRVLIKSKALKETKKSNDVNDLFVFYKKKLH